MKSIWHELCCGLCWVLFINTAVNAFEIQQCPRTAQMPAGLKMDGYRGITPDCVPGAATIDVVGLLNLLERRTDTVLIDVWAALLRYEEDFGGEWLINQPHDSLPNAVWLPNIGYGNLKPYMHYYLQQNLQRLTQGDKKRPLVFFCVADCWMSWNAVQRVRKLGYEQVYWFKFGIDGWEEAGFSLTEAQPIPFISAPSQ